MYLYSFVKILSAVQSIKTIKISVNLKINRSIGCKQKRGGTFCGFTAYSAVFVLGIKHKRRTAAKLKTYNQYKI